MKNANESKSSIHAVSEEPISPSRRRERSRALRGVLPCALVPFILLGVSAVQAQSISAGANLWATFNATTNPTGKNCSSCHSLTAGDARVNAGDPSSASSAGAGIILRAINNNAVTGMGSISTNDTERRSLAMYIESVVNVTPISVSVSYNTSKVQNIGNYVVMNTSATDLDVLETGTSPTKGTVSYTVGTPSFTYTPASGQCGSDSFTYRARDTGGLNHATGYRTVNITIANPGAPNISASSGAVLATFGNSMTWTPASTGTTPRAYALTGTLPAGLSFSTTTGVISGTPTDASDDTSVTVTAYTCLNGNLTGQSSSRTVSISIAQASQSISWGSLPTKTFGTGNFTISPLATASSGLSVSYTSATTGVCTVSGSTVTMVSGGTCTLNANQSGNTNYSAATQVQRSFVISPASQTITFSAQTTASRSFSPGGTFAISPTATASSGLAVTYSSGNTAVCTVSGTTVTMVAAGTCPIRANQAGNASYSAATQVTQNVTINATVPGAPTGVGGSSGDGGAQVTFSAPSNNGGTAITSYTATCTASGQTTRTATANSLALNVTSMTNGVTYACSVTAANVIGSSVASASVNFTPTATPVAPAFTSANSTSFTVLNAGNFSVTASGVPAPTFTVLSGSLPSGVTLSSGGALSGAPASGTAGSYPVTLRATNSAGTANQSFTLTVGKLSQSIDFSAPADRDFGPDTVPLDGTATSGLAVNYVSTTPSVCSITGANVTLLSIGTCEINASQAGNADFQAAGDVLKSFKINQGSQTISFAPTAQTISYPVGGTFAVNPLAAASSGLAVSYASNTPAVCTVAGTAVTVVAIGDCIIEAEQPGNANYMAAPPVTRTVTIQKANQTISFAATQAAQNFSSGGTFGLSPAGTSGSGLAVVYTSLTPDVCTVDEMTVSILSVGVCTIAANQAGNEFYNAAAQVTRNITINPVVPGAPTIGSGTPANGSAAITFLPPEEDGGAAITSYTVTCNPGAASGAGAASPVVVSGLTNGQQYACSVAAVNSAGTGPSSATTNVTPFAATGAALWASVCTACHTPTPEGIQLNGAGTTATVLAHVRANQESMILTPAVQALSNADLALIAAYINDNVPNIVVTTPPNTAKTISVSSHVTLVGSVAFNAVEVVTPPTNGTLGAWFAGGRSITYTPANGFSGTDSFTYRPKHTTSGLLGDPRTVTINITSSTATLTISPAGLGEGTVNSSPFGVVNCYMAGGEVQSGICNSVLFPLNTPITLTAAAFEGSVAGGWSGVSCSGGNSGSTCSFTLNSNTTVTATFNPDVVGTIARFDLNDDGKGDIVWRNGSTGENYLYPMDGRTILPTEGFFRSVATAWTVAGMGDFDGDGKADILWRNSTTGENYIYFMDGRTILPNEGYIRTVTAAWTVGGVADFDGDGKADILWRNTTTGENYLYFMDGKTIKPTEGYTRTVATTWVPAAVADFDGDGKADILWRNSSTGENYMYPMDGRTIKATEGFIRTVPTNWILAGSGDFTGDSKADILWRNTGTGENYLYPMDGRTILATEGFIRTVSIAWTAASITDFDGDGKADILWRNGTTGENYVYPMDGRTIKSTEGFIRSVAVGWSVMSR